jgi:hypothetical protein
MPPKAAKYHPKPPDAAHGRQTSHQAAKTPYGMRRNNSINTSKGVAAATCRRSSPTFENLYLFQKNF